MSSLEVDVKSLQFIPAVPSPPEPVQYSTSSALTTPASNVDEVITVAGANKLVNDAAICTPVGPITLSVVANDMIAGKSMICLVEYDIRTLVLMHCTDGYVEARRETQFESAVAIDDRAVVGTGVFCPKRVTDPLTLIAIDTMKY